MEVGLDYQVHQKIEGSEHERANEIDVPAAAALLGVEEPADADRLARRNVTGNRGASQTVDGAAKGGE
jgi:hypothetical protein